MADITTLHSLTRAPMLESDGSNWAVFSQKFKWHLEGLGLDTHFSKENYPTPFDEEEPKDDEDDEDSKFESKMAAWRTKSLKWRGDNKDWVKDEGRAKSQLANAIPNSVFLECCQFTTFIDMWTFVKHRFKKRTRMQKSALRGKLNSMLCSKKSDLKTHLMEMEMIYQQLASRNVSISNEDYCNMIIHSLPPSYQIIASNLDTVLEYSDAKMTPSILKDHLLKEYET